MSVDDCGPMMWAPSSLRGLGVGDQLDERRGVLHRPAVRGGPVVLDRRDERDALGGRLPLGEPDRGDLRTAEHRMGDDRVVHALDVVGMGDVVEHHLRLRVGHVLELVAVRQVTERPDALDVGLEVVVDDDPARRVAPHARGLDVELVAVGDAAGGDEHLVTFQRPPRRPRFARGPGSFRRRPARPGRSRCRVAGRNARRRAWCSAGRCRRPRNAGGTGRG